MTEADEDADRIYRLRDEFDREAQRYAVGAEVGSTVFAEDATGCVRVDIAGAAQEITVRDAWRSHYSPEQLAAAVVATVEAASWERVRATEDALPDEAPPIRPAAPVSASPAARLVDGFDESEIDVLAVLERLSSTITEMTDRLDGTFDAIAARGTRSREGLSPAARVVATVRGAGQLTGLSFDPEWIEVASGADVTREIAAALAAATPDDDDPLRGTPLEDFSAFLADGDALSRYLLHGQRDAGRTGKG